MITTNNTELAERSEDAAESRLSRRGTTPRLLGGNFRLDAIQAAVLRVKLRYLDRWTKARQNNAAEYRQVPAARGRPSR